MNKQRNKLCGAIHKARVAIDNFDKLHRESLAKTINDLSLTTYCYKMITIVYNMNGCEHKLIFPAASNMPISNNGINCIYYSAIIVKNNKVKVYKNAGGDTGLIRQDIMQMYIEEIRLSNKEEIKLYENNTNLA